MKIRTDDSHQFSNVKMPRQHYVDLAIHTTHTFCACMHSWANATVLSTMNERYIEDGITGTAEGCNT
jgi:hypothetical protein